MWRDWGRKDIDSLCEEMGGKNEGRERMDWNWDCSIRIMEEMEGDGRRVYVRRGKNRKD